LLLISLANRHPAPQSLALLISILYLEKRTNMRPRTRLNEQHAATPLPTAAADGRRILRSHRKMQGNRSIDSNASNVAAAAIPAKAASLTQSANVDRIIPSSAAEPADVAPLFRAHAERTLEQIRGVVESRKGAMEEKVEDLRRQLRGQLLFAKRSLPDSVRSMKVKDYDARYDCDLLEMLKGRALGIFLGLEEDDDDDMAEACPATIRRGAGRGTGRRPLPSSSAAEAAASAVVAAPAGYATPAVARAKPSNAAFWSTTAKKYVERRQPNIDCNTYVKQPHDVPICRAIPIATGTKLLPSRRGTTVPTKRS
jgi:Nbl1 / Borealin N terminal